MEDVNNLEQLAEGARAYFDGANRAREEALSLSRELVRTSANSIRASHRLDHAQAEELLARANSLASSLRRFRDERPDIYYAGYVQDSLKEYAEACSVFALVNGQPVRDAAVLDIPWAAYLNGLGEAIGEMRRFCLDLLRQQQTQRAEQALETMDGIYAILVTIDYPDALTGGLRRTTDMARGILERTRADLTTAVLQQRLSADMEQLGARLQERVQ